MLCRKLGRSCLFLGLLCLTVFGLPLKAPAQTLEVSTDKLPFGVRDVGTSTLPFEVSFRNKGQKPLKISGIPTSGTTTSDFTFNTKCGNSLDPDQKCEISVVFRPSAAEKREFALTIADDAGDSPQTITVSGTGFAAVVPSPGSITFDPQTVGTRSPLRGVKVTNYLGSPATVTSVAGDEDLLEIQSDCATLSPLKPGAICHVYLTFNPKCLGTHTGSVTITYQDAQAKPPVTSTRSIAIVGVGTAESSLISTLRGRYGQAGWALLIALLYLIGIIIIRWHMIARPNRNFLRAQISSLQTRLKFAPGLSPELKTSLGEVLTEADKPFAKPGLMGTVWDFLFWTRGQEAAAWVHVHDIECQLIEVMPLESIRAGMEVAELELRHLGTPIAMAVADKINAELKAISSSPLEHWKSLLEEVSIRLKPETDVLASTISSALSVDRFRELVQRTQSLLHPQASALADRIKQVLTEAAKPAAAGAATPGPPVALMQEVDNFLKSISVDEIQQALTSSPPPPSEWKSLLQEILDFFEPLRALTNEVEGLLAPGATATFAQCQPLLQKTLDLLSLRPNELATKIGQILTKTSTTLDQLKPLLEKAVDWFSLQGGLARNAKQALDSAVPLDRCKPLLADLSNWVTPEALALSAALKQAADPSSNLTVAQVKSLLQSVDTLLTQQVPVLATLDNQINQALATIGPPPLRRWRSLLFEATGLIYRFRDIKYDALSSWQNKAMWLVGCAILLVVTLATVVQNAVFFVVGAVGGFLSRLGRELKREEVPSDYGASWATLFLSPVVGAIAGWAGMLLAIMLAQLGILGSALKLDWNNPYEPVALGMAFILGFSERLFDTVLSKLEEGIFKQPTPSATAPPSPLKITSNAKLKDGKVGQDYKDLNIKLEASGGSPGYTWSVTAGSLPGGMRLDPSGQIMGAPLAPGGPTKFTAQVVDKANAKAVQEFNIAITS